MRPDPGGFWSVINSQHLRPVIKFELYINESWQDYTELIRDIRYSAAISDTYGPASNIGATSRTEVSVTMKIPSGISVTSLYRARARVSFSFAGLSNHVTVFDGLVGLASVENDTFCSMTAVDRGTLGGIQKRAYTSLWESKWLDEIIELISTSIGLSASVSYKSSIWFPLFWLDGETLLEQMLRLAQFDGGYVYVDGTTLNYYSGWPDGNPVWNLSWQTDFTSKEVRYSIQNDYDKVSAQNRIFERGKVAKVYSLPEPIRIPPGSVKRRFLKFNTPCWVNGPKWVWSIDYHHSDPNGDSCTLYYDNYTDPLTAARNGVGTNVYVGGWDLELHNTNTTFDVFLNKLDIYAVPMVSSPLDEEESGTEEERVYQIPDSDLLQTEYIAKSVVAMFTDRFILPDNGRPTISLSGVKPNPLLVVGDMISVDGESCMVTGISWSSPRYDMTVDCISLTNAPGAAGPPFFVIGSSTLNTGPGMYY